MGKDCGLENGWKAGLGCPFPRGAQGRFRGTHLAEDNVVGTHHQQVAFKLLDNLLLHPVMHI